MHVPAPCTHRLENSYNYSVKDIALTLLQSCMILEYGGTSDKGPSEMGTTSLQRTFVLTPC